MINWRINQINVENINADVIFRCGGAEEISGVALVFSVHKCAQRGGRVR